MTEALVAGLAVFAVGLLRRPRPRLPELDHRVGPEPERSDERSLLARLRIPLSILAAVAGWSVFGGAAGPVVGLGAGAASWRVLSRVESPAQLRRRTELERDLPLSVHLLAACLEAGASVERSLEAVSAAVPGVMGEELDLVRRRLRWGSDAGSVWRSIDGPLQPLGRTMARAQDSGASVRYAVAQLAADLRAETQVRAGARARTIEVRAAAPLGICFLPAFVVLGVVPMAAGLFSSLRLFA